MSADNIIYIDDALALSSGVDKEGYAKGSVAFNITRLKADRSPYTYREEIVHAPFDFYCSKGAVVAVCDFPSEESNAFATIYGSCQEYLKQVKEGTVKQDEILSLMVIPLSLDGQLMILLHNLLFCDFSNKPNGVSHLVLVFDNTETVLSTPEDIDYDAIVAEVEAELLAEEQALDHEIMELELEEERLKKEQMNAELGINDLVSVDEDEDVVVDNIRRNHRVKFGGDDDEN